MYTGNGLSTVGSIRVSMSARIRNMVSYAMGAANPG